MVSLSVERGEQISKLLKRAEQISKVERAEHLKHQVCWRGESCHSHSTNDDYDNDYNDDDDDYDNDYNDDDDDEECEPAVREVLPVVS